jgi:hypothetical protein
VFETTTGVAKMWTGSTWSAIQSDFLHIMADDSTILQAQLPLGHIALSQSSGNMFINRATGWAQWGIRTYADRAAMMADSPADNSIAVADNRMYIRVAGAWVGMPVQSYPTEADLQADSPPDGTIAMAEDTGLVFGRANGAWQRVNSPTMTVAATAPTAPVLGDLFYDTTASTASIYDGSSWSEIAGGNEIAVTQTMPTVKNEGDLWWQPSVERMRIYQNGAYHWAEPSAIRFAHWTTNSSQSLFNFPASQFPEKYMRLRGLIYSTGVRRLMLIGQRNGSWIDWDDLMNWGFCLEMAYNGANPFFERPDQWAETNAGMYLHKSDLNLNEPMLLDLRMDFVASEPMFSMRLVGKSSAFAITSTIDASMKAGFWNTRMSSIGLKGGDMQGRLTVEWA